MITNLNRFTPENILSEYNKYITSGGYPDNLVSFEAFIGMNGLNLRNAKSVYNFLHSGNFLDLPEVYNIELRKSHPKRDKFIKKRAFPAVLAGGAIWGILSLLAFAIASGVPSILGTQILSDMTANNINFITQAVGYTAAGFFGGIAIKNAATKRYYNKKYGAEKTLTQLTKGKELAKTELAELVKAISKSNEKIYNLRNGKFITKPFRFIARHALNIVNRNRVHQFAKTVEDLLEKFYNKMNDNAPTNADKFKDEELKNIVNLIEYLNTAYENDIIASKLFILLDEKEALKNKHMVEILDIWSKLNMLADAAERAGILTKDIKKEVEKDYEKMKKDQIVYEVARRNFNENPNFVNRCVLERYYSLNVSETVETPIVEEEPITTPITEPIEFIFPQPTEETSSIDDIIASVAEETVEEEPEITFIEETPEVEEIVEENVEETITETQPQENLIKRSAQRLQAKVKVDELTRGNKVTITNLQNNSKETIKVTSTPSGTKINVEVKKADGTILKNSYKNSSNEIDTEVKRILQETALNSGVDLEQLNLI